MSQEMTTLVGWLELNIPFQHKYGYISDENNVMKPSTVLCNEPAVDNEFVQQEKTTIQTTFLDLDPDKRHQLYHAY